MNAIKGFTGSHTVLPTAKLYTKAARYWTINLLFFGQIFKISITHLKSMFAKMRKRRWWAFWTVWMCVEGVYVFRHRDRCDCSPKPLVQLVNERLAVAN